MSVTCVTCFYQIDNKHGTKYLDWFHRTLKINAPYVFFGTKETIELVQPFRTGLPTVYVERDLADFVTAKFRDKLIVDPIHSPSVELGLVWNEKIFMMKDAVTLNPFQTDYFAWVDAGLCVYRETPPPPISFQYTAFLNPDKFNHTSADHSVTGTYAIPTSLVYLYASLYLDKLTQVPAILTDQITWSAIYADKPNLFHCVGQGYGTLFQKFYEEKVTVIIATYNRFDLLMNTIQSVRAQTHSNVEIVVVDDRSTQAQYLKHQWKDIHYIRLPKNSKDLFGFGAPGGYQRNFGINVAQGIYLAFCDDDDVWMPTKLEKQLVEMKRTGSNICSTNAWIFHGTTNTNKEYLPPLPSDMTLGDISETNWVICSSVVIHKSMVSKSGVFNVMPHADDYDYWKRIMQHTNLIYLSEPLVGYDMNHGYGKMWGSSKTLVGHDMNLGYGKMGKEPKKINMMFFRPPA